MLDAFASPERATVMLDGSAMLRDDACAYEKDRGIALVGPTAVTWMAERGFMLAHDDALFRVAGDAIRSQDFAVIRLWHNASSLTRASTENGLVVGFLLEGEVQLDVDGKALRLNAPGGYAYRSAWGLREISTGSTALIEVHLSAEAMLRLDVPVAEGLFELQAELRTARIFLAAVSAVLNARVTPRFARWEDVRKSVEFAVRAVLGEAEVPRRDTAVSRLSQIRERARAQIDRRCTDPQFTVSVLSEEIGVSQTRLHAAFADARSTPAIEIRRARLSLATSMLAGDERPAPQRRAEIARASGFRSVKAMSRAQASVSQND